MDIELWKAKKKELGLTFPDLSLTTGVSVRTLKSLFSGERENTTTFTKNAIEKALGITNEPTINLSSKEKEIVELLMQLDESQLNDALSVIKIIAKK